jgi:hypothetical protein
MEKQTFKKSILLGVLFLYLVNTAYGAAVEERADRLISRSPTNAYFEDDVAPRSADVSGADDTSDSEWEEKQEGRKPGKLGDNIFAKFGGAKKPKLRKHRQPEDSETERKFLSPGTIENVRMDEITREVFRDHIHQALAYINQKKWRNTVRGQQAKYEALLKQLTEDELSEPEINSLKTLSNEEREILAREGVSSGIESDNEEVFRPQEKVFRSLTPDRSESEEASQKTIQSLDRGTIEAFRKHVTRIAKEVSGLNWFSSPKEQKDKFNALVTRLQSTFY